MLYIYTRKFWQSKNGEILFFRHHIISGTSTLLREPQPKVQVEYIFQSAILKMMSNQVEVNNNTIDVESRRVHEGKRLAEEEGNLLKNKCGASFEIEEAGNEEQNGGDEKVEPICLEVIGKVEETGAGADVESTLVKGTKEDRLSLENVQGALVEEIDRPSFGGEIREIEITDESSTEMNSVVEFSGSAGKTKDDKEDDVSRLLAALRALCTSANTDVVLLCGAWQMRAHSEVLRARSHALAEMLGTSDGQQARTTVKLRLNMDPGALGIAVNYMYFNEVRMTVIYAGGC